VSVSVSPIGSVSVLSSLGTTPISFDISSSLVTAVQDQLTGSITNVVNANTSYDPIVAVPITLAADGSTASLPSAVSGFTTGYDIYLSGTVTGGGSIALPVQAASGSRGFAAIIATFTGNETVTGGAGLNALVVAGANTNLTYDPLGGTGVTTLYGGGGNNNFTLDGKNISAVVAAGDNTITAAAYSASPYSYNTISTAGGNNLITLNAGQDTVMSGGYRYDKGRQCRGLHHRIRDVGRQHDDTVRKQFRGCDRQRRRQHAWYGR
jgi:hypothetical protein